MYDRALYQRYVDTARYVTPVTEYRLYSVTPVIFLLIEIYRNTDVDSARYGILALIQRVTEYWRYGIRALVQNVTGVTLRALRNWRYVTGDIVLYSI